MKRLSYLGALILAALLAGAAASPRDKAVGLQNKGYFYSLRGDRAKTDENYGKAIALDPDGSGHLLSYGWALYNLGDYEAALAKWHEAFTGRDREYLNRAICLAMVHEKLGHPELAVEWYQVQCLAVSDFASLPGLRQFTLRWQPGEQKVSEELYHRWRAEKDASEKLRARVQTKSRTWEEFQQAGAPAFQLQQHLDGYFAAEVRKTPALIRPGASFALSVTVHPDGSVGVDPHQAEDTAFTHPLLSILAIHTLQAYAEHPASLAAGQTAPLTFPIRFEVELATAAK